MTCGIYKLSFEGTDKVYIGKSKNIESRFIEHKRYLRTGRASKKMQEAYSAYGLPTLDILLECEEAELVDAEIEAIGIYNSVDQGFNSVAESRGGSLGLYGELAPTAQYSNSQYISAATLLAETNLTVAEIALQLNMKRAVVASIKHLAAHGWIEIEYPDLYIRLKTKLNSYRSLSNSAEYKGLVYPKLESPEGLVYEVTCINDFARQHKLDSGNLCRLLNGDSKSHRGWYLYGSRPSKVKLVSPLGEVVCIDGTISNFAKDNALDISALCKVIKGKKPQHKGWALFKDESIAN